MLLADFAQVADGKLTVVGGGWSLTGPEPAPFGIAILVHVPWDQANRRHLLRLELLDADGEQVLVTTDDGDEAPIVFFDDIEFEVGRPAGIKPGTPLELPLAITSEPAATRARQAVRVDACRSTAGRTTTGGSASGCGRSKSRPETLVTLCHKVGRRGTQAAAAVASRSGRAASRSDRASGPNGCWKHQRVIVSAASLESGSKATPTVEVPSPV